MGQMNNTRWGILSINQFLSFYRILRVILKTTFQICTPDIYTYGKCVDVLYFTALCLPASIRVVDLKIKSDQEEMDNIPWLYAGLGWHLNSFAIIDNRNCIVWTKPNLTDTQHLLLSAALNKNTRQWNFSFSPKIFNLTVFKFSLSPSFCHPHLVSL